MTSKLPYDPWWSEDSPIGELYVAWWSENDSAEELRLINERSTDMLVEFEMIANEQVKMNLRRDGTAVRTDVSHQDLLHFREDVRYVLGGRKGE